MSSTAMNGDKPPPCMRKKMRKQSPETSILSLPNDLLLNCLARVSRLYHPTLSLVSKKFRSVVASAELYKTRSLLHRTESFIYLCLRNYYPDDPNTYWFALRGKPNRTLTNDDLSSGNRFIPIPSPHLRPAQSLSIVAVGSNIYKIGGGGYDLSSSRVSVLDCRFNTWHSAPKMREKRIFPGASVVDGKIYVAGGCEDPSSVNWVEVFDTETRTWGNVTNPGTETRPGAEVVSLGIEGKLYLFGRDDEGVVYDPKEASWSPIGLDTDMACAWCFCSGVIGDVLFIWIDGVFSWYDSKARSWKTLIGVGILPDIGGHLPDIGGLCKMVDLGGNMAVLWESYRDDSDGHTEQTFIWCAEITLERCSEDEMWGNVKWCDVVLTPHESCLFSADVLSATL